MYTLGAHQNIFQIELINRIQQLQMSFSQTKIGYKEGKSSATEIFSYFSTKTYVVGTQKNRLNETVHLSTQNIC